MRSIRLGPRRCAAWLVTLPSLALAPAVGAQEDVPELRREAELEADAPEESVQEVEEDFSGIEEITVTAQKRSQQLQEVPIAVSALSGGQLDEAGFTQMQDIQSLVPNLHFGQENGTAKVTIRGISSAQGTDQSTAFHIDGVYQNRQKSITALTFFDVERIEVLRGPQGTLYGRNATGGAINVISKPPSDDFELFGDVQFGNYWQQMLRGVANLPLADEKGALRVAGYYENRSGYQKNFYFPGRDQDADDAKDWALRGQLKLVPTETLDVTFRLNVFQNGGVGYGIKRDGPLPATVAIPIIGPQPIYAGATPNPTNARHVYEDIAQLDDDGDPMTPPQQVYASIDETLLSGNAEAQWLVPKMPLFGDTKLKVLGSYQTFDANVISDQDYSDVFIAYLDDDEFYREWVAEINWSSDEDRRWGWLVGLFHLGGNGDREVFAPAFLEVTQGPLAGVEGDLTVNQFFDSDIYSVAGFVHGWVDLTDELKLEAGFRYSHDWKNQSLRSDQASLPNPLFPIGPPEVVIFTAIDDPRKDHWGRPSGSASLSWQYTEENLLYGRFATGYKSGSINNDIATLGGGLVVPPNAGLEDIYSLEIGSKNTLLDSRLLANFTVFGYFYDDLQVSQLFEAQNIIDNAAAARVLGVETEFTYRPIDPLTFIAQFSYLHTQYTDYDDCIDAKDLQTTVVYEDCTGNELTRAPRFSGTFIAMYEQDLGRFGSVTPFAQVYASDKVYFRPTNDPEDEQPAYYLLNFRLMWQSEDGRLGVDLFVENALDEDVATTKIVGSALLGAPQLSAYDRPRTLGARFHLSWR